MQVLGVGAEPGPAVPEDAISYLPAPDVPAQGLDLAGELAAEDPRSRPPDSERDPGEEPERERHRELAGESLRKSLATRSPWLTGVAWTRIRTSPSFGLGLSISASRRTSGGRYASLTTALMVSRI